MDTSQFTFPPPPPPPPLPPQTSHNNPDATRSSYANTRFNGGRGNRGNGGFGGRGQGSSRSSSRGGFSGPRQNNGNFAPRGNYVPTTNLYNGSNPSADYPPIQQPQFLAGVQNSYVHQPSVPPHQLVAPPSDYAYHENLQRPPQYHNGHQQNIPYPHNPQNFNTAYASYDSAKYGASSSNLEITNQPAFVGPPIRMGFKRDHQEAYQQEQTQHHGFPYLVENHSPAYQNNLNRAEFRPPFQHHPSSRYTDRRESPNPFPGNRSRGQKRGHQEAFHKPQFSASKSITRFQVAPAVPSFGIPLPVKPPTPQETGRRKKKKRRHNQLGLTPKTVEYESSEEEENDVDEEIKLAAAAGLPDLKPLQLQFTYKGKTSTLQSLSEITAWIEERKKRYPTKARIEENAARMRQLHEEFREAKRDRDSTAKQNAESKGKQKAEARAKRKTEANLKEPAAVSESGRKNPFNDSRKESQENYTSDNAATKAKLKIEKLRRRLEKEEKRAAKAEAKMSKLKAEAARYKEVGVAPLAKIEATGEFECRASENRSVSVIVTENKAESETRKEPPDPASLKQENLDLLGMRVEEATKADSGQIDLGVATMEICSKVPDPLTPTSQPSILGLPDPNPEQKSSTDPIAPPVQPMDILLCTTTKSEVLAQPSTATAPNSPTSSNNSITSSSSSSPSLSTDSMDDSTSSAELSSSSPSSSAPESRPAGRTKPDKVPPPKRQKPKAICRNFLQHGRCRKGDACRFRHELPQRGSQAERHRRRKRQAPREEKKPRTGLYQRLVEQEKARENAEAGPDPSQAEGNQPPMMVLETGANAMPI